MTSSKTGWRRADGAVPAGLFGRETHGLSLGGSSSQMHQTIGAGLRSRPHRIVAEAHDELIEWREAW